MNIEKALDSLIELEMEAFDSGQLILCERLREIKFDLIDIDEEKDILKMENI